MLTGLRIVVTRAVHQAEELAAPLRELGAEVILVPVIAIAPPSNAKPLEEARARAQQYDWIIFTSANAVAAFGAIAQGSARIATVGAATREVAGQHGFHVSVTPGKYVAESLVESLGASLAGKRVLIPSAAVARDVVPVELRKRGATVDVVEAYRNVVPAEAAQRVTEVFRDPIPDWVTFASSSAVDNLVQLAGLRVLKDIRIATIGPVTSRTVEKHGLQVAAEAQIHTVEGLVNALAA
jgi:uroporphyrinogen-III synthase